MFVLRGELGWFGAWIVPDAPLCCWEIPSCWKERQRLNMSITSVTSHQKHPQDQSHDCYMQILGATQASVAPQVVPSRTIGNNNSGFQNSLKYEIAKIVMEQAGVAPLWERISDRLNRTMDKGKSVDIMYWDCPKGFE